MGKEEHRLTESEPGWRPEWKRKRARERVDAKAAVLQEVEKIAGPEREDWGVEGVEKVAALKAYARSGLWSQAEKESGVGRSVILGWIEDGGAFAKAWEEARRIGMTYFEDEMRIRARSGVMDASSGPMLTKVLEAEMPEKYSSRRVLDVTSRVIKEVQVTDLRLPEGWTREMLESATDG